MGSLKPPKALTDRQESGIKFLCDEFRKNNNIDPALYEKFNVKRGLRNNDGSGVMAGLTLICNVHGYVISEGEREPIEGRLIYRGIDILDIIRGAEKDNRFGFEETAYLLLFGRLPTSAELKKFMETLDEFRELPESFVEDMIIKAPSNNVMNKLAGCVLALYSYDNSAEDYSLENVIRQSIELISRAPTIVCRAYQVKKYAYENQSMVVHPHMPGQSIAESILSMLRVDRQYTDEEAKLLDLCLTLHAEHGGGNNSTFACRVLTSSGTDTYSAIASGVGSLKGPKHGGANIKVMEMLEYMKTEIGDPYSDAEVKDYLAKLVRKEAGDHSGLIYGMGHAVYTLSDPRAIVLKEKARTLLESGNFAADFHLLDAVERLAPVVMSEIKNTDKVLCSNVDLYSGLIYRYLDIPHDLFTPLFAIARMTGWCAHRIEELLFGTRIIRPAYKSVAEPIEYVPIDRR